MAAEPREPRPSQPPQLAQGTGDRAAKAASNPLARVKPRVGAPTGPIVGVDLGTTNSCVAVVKDGKPEVILSREGHNTIPSIVALNARQHIVVGHPARKQMLTNAKLTVFGAKRLVGRPYASDVVQRVKDHFQYSIVEGADGEAAVRLGGEVFSLQQLSAMILIEAKELASTHLGVEVQRAVITVPAYYNEHQRQAVRAAGALAGLHVERIINEPTAAALAFGYRRKLEKRVLVYDLGGGTFDASLMHIGNDVYEVLATGGDTFLGGVDFDQAIADHLAAEATAALGSEFAPSPEVRQRLVDAAEHAKRLLSEQSEARVALPFLAMRPNGKPFDLDVVLTRATVDELCAPLVERTVQVCQEVTKAAKVWPDQIDDVLLVGGMSRMPLVRQAIVALTGKQPNAGVHPDEAVALGAALFAASLGQVEGVTLIDVLPMSIGVGVPGGAFKKLIERNARLPATKSFTLTTVRDNQDSIQLAIYQGEGEHTDEAEYLGTAKVSPLPPGPKGSVSVELEFALSEECLLTVTARDLARQQLVQSTFSTRDTPDVVKARVARAQRIAAAVQAARAATAAKAGKVQTAAREPQGGWLARFFRRLFGGG